jgi:iron(III) transport system permease protein
VLLALVPFFAIVVLSFLEFRGPVLHGNFSGQLRRGLFDRAMRPFANTLIFASLAALCVTLVGVPIGYVVTRWRAGAATARCRGDAALCRGGRCWRSASWCRSMRASSC